MKPNKNLIFLHIPKNGGTTFHSILERMFPLKNTFTFRLTKNRTTNRDVLVNLPLPARKKIKLLKGHFPFGLDKYLVGESEYITFLRKPEDRIVSYYYYVLSQPNHDLYPIVKNEEMTIYDFVTKIKRRDVNNAQVRMISGVNNRDDDMLEKALENVENHFSFIGLVEQFDESLVLLKEMYSSKTLFYKHLNKRVKTAVKPGLDKKTREAIAELNSQDVLFYKAMKERFSRELAKQDNLDDELEKLYKCNNLYKFYPINTLRRIKIVIRNGFNFNW